MRPTTAMPRPGGADMFQAAINLRVRPISVGPRGTLVWSRRRAGGLRGSPEASDCDRSRRPRRNDLVPPPVAISIEYTVAGSPQDERLCREQTRAVLDLLADIIERRGERAA